MDEVHDKALEDELRKFRAELEQCKKTEKALKENEEKYRILVEEAGDVMYASDFEGRFTYVNPACAKLTGYSQEELEGKHFSDLLGPKWKERVVNFYANQFKNRIPETLFSFPLITKSGEEKWVEQTVVQMKDGDRISGYRAIVRDITDRKTAEALLVQKSEELENNVALLELANKELESFSYSVSHDLRAPIRAILNFSVIVQQRLENTLDEETNTLLTSIANAAKRMGSLTDDLLHFIQLGRREIRKSEVDMVALANEAVAEVLKANEGKYKAKIKVCDLPATKCDHYLMLQAFINLLTNALKFSSMKPDPVIEIGARTEHGMTTYYVKDNGVGFDMKYYNKLFGVFQRLQAMNEFPGTGIGLATVKKIVTRHGGTVTAEGKLNEGATFYISLPAEYDANTKLIERPKEQ